jgi:hypothetical protein
MNMVIFVNYKNEPFLGIFSKYVQIQYSVFFTLQG